MAVSEDEQVLLARHVPELRYHVLEQYRADSAETFTDNAVPGKYGNELRRRDPDELIAAALPARGHPKLSLGMLVPAGKPYFHGGPAAAPGDYLKAHPGTLAQDAARMHELPGYRNVCYGRVATGTDGSEWLQYWFFYYHNPFHVGPVGVHQGDWEMVQIGLTDAREPDRVTYAQHDRGEARLWGAVTKVDGGARPVVYVAKGSHASYFRAGTQERPDLPFGIGSDHTSDGVEPVKPDVLFVDPTEDRWLAWPGAWGATENLTDHSPAGPAEQEQRWRRPDEFNAQARSADEVLAAARELEARPAPPVPRIAAHVDGGDLVVTYGFPRHAAGTTVAIRLELAVHGTSGLPTTGAVPVGALRGSIRQPLPASPGPYRLEVGAYDEDDSETLAPPLVVTAEEPRRRPG